MYVYDDVYAIRLTKYAHGNVIQVNVNINININIVYMYITYERVGELKYVGDVEGVLFRSNTSMHMISEIISEDKLSILTIRLDLRRYVGGNT